MEASATVPASSSSAGASYYELLVGQAEWADVAVMGVGGVAALVHGASIPVFLHFLGKLIDSLGSSAEPSDLMANQVSKYVLYFVYLSLVRLGTGWIEVSMWMYNGERQVTRLRRRYLKALLSQHVGFFDTNVSTGEVLAHIASDTILIQESIGAKNEVGWFDRNSSTLLASRLSADAPLVKLAIVDRVITLVQNVGLIVTAFLITLNLHWKIALIMIVSFPALIGSYAGEIQFMKGFSSDLHEAYMKANGVAGEAISNIGTVAAFAAENKVMDLFCKELNETRKKSFVQGQRAGLSFGVSQFVMFSWCGLALWYGSVLIRKGEASFSQAMKCFMVFLITAFSIAEALTMSPELLLSTKILHKVFEILERRTEIDVEDPEAKEVLVVSGTIEFRNVDFSYPSRADVPILSNFNLQITRGHKQALVGASGSGKSTVVSLIARFYDPQSGRVLVDGQDIKQLRLESLRRHIGLVQQEPALFSTSIYENICYGKEGATEAEIVEAAKTANVHGFISALPRGYMTQVGEGGIQLSGGQKQRVAIARAVLKNPSILLLDEASSALDMESEKLLQEAFDKMTQKCTTVVVAHRLSTVKNAHSIAVLENGSIKEQGSHLELIAQQGTYFQLFNIVGSENRTSHD